MRLREFPKEEEGTYTLNECYEGEVSDMEVIDGRLEVQRRI